MRQRKYYAVDEEGQIDSTGDGRGVRSEEGEASLLCESEQGNNQRNTQVSSTVESQEYQGVSVEHPRIVEAIKILKRQGKKTEDIMRIVGMPSEVVQSVHE